MRRLTDGELIELLDQASALGPVERALWLLAKASPERTIDDLAQLPVGGRDRLLLQLREWMFGSTMMAVLRCPACQASLEVSFDTADIRFGDAVPSAGPFDLRVAGADLGVRLPTSLDLAALHGCRDAIEGERLLLERCVWIAGGDRLGDELLTSEIHDAVDQLMAQADPQADIRLTATCPECDNGWLALFDIASFFWKEIRAFANQFMLDVHTLASCYGWAERDILAMSPWRRQRYVAMVQG